MGGWLALAIAALGIAVLAVALFLLAGRMRELRHQQYRIGKRVKDVEQLATKMETITQRAAEMEQSMQVLQRSAETLQERMKPATESTG